MLVLTLDNAVMPLIHEGVNVKISSNYNNMEIRSMALGMIRTVKGS